MPFLPPCAKSVYLEHFQKSTTISHKVNPDLIYCAAFQQEHGSLKTPTEPQKMRCVPRTVQYLRAYKYLILSDGRGLAYHFRAQLKTWQEQELEEEREAGQFTNSACDIVTVIHQPSWRLTSNYPSSAKRIPWAWMLLKWLQTDSWFKPCGGGGEVSMMVVSRNLEKNTHFQKPVGSMSPSPCTFS